MIKAVLLDLGGVLTVNKTNPKGPKENLKISPEIWHKAGLGLIDDKIAFEEMARNHQVDSQTIKEWLFSKREPNRGVLSLLAKLKPEIKKGIISNSLKTIFSNFNNQYNLQDIFDVMVISAEEHVKKPDKEIFLRACQRLDIKPNECIFVDNDIEHTEAAKKFGMRAVLFTTLDKLEKEFHHLKILKSS